MRTDPEATRGLETALTEELEVVIEAVAPGGRYAIFVFAENLGGALEFEG